MRSNYKQLGQFIRQVDVRNVDGKEDNLLGVSVQKTFIPSIANTVGTDFTKYKVVKKEFRCVFSFDSCENMLCAIEKLHKAKHRSSCISKLIYCNDCYHLLLSSLRPINTGMSHIISEYSGKRSTNKIFISYILEHGKTLEKNNAIEKIGTALCKS